VEYERVSNLALREIWPDAYGEDAANVTADMATLRQHGASAEAAAKHLSALIDQARRLLPR
jgi:hypothetical protein